jgi:CysZ protein
MGASMTILFSAIGALALAIKDVLTPRLFFLALICLLAVGALAFAAAWACATFLPPYIPDGHGIWRYASRAAEIALSLGAGLLVIVFAPAIAMIVGGLLFDVAAEKVERAIGAPEARAVPLGEALGNGLRIGAGALALNILVLPVLFIPPLYPIVFMALNGYLFGREYFTQAAVRHMSFDDARAMRKRAPLAVFIVGLGCSVVAFIAPLLAASAMARLVAAMSNSDSGKAA